MCHPVVFKDLVMHLIRKKSSGLEVQGLNLFLSVHQYNNCSYYWTGFSCLGNLSYALTRKTQGGQWFNQRAHGSWLLVSRLWVQSQLWMPTPYCLGQYSVTGWDKSCGLPALTLCGNTLNCSVNLETCLGYSLVADEDLKKTNQTNFENPSHHPLLAHLTIKGTFFDIGYSTLRRQFAQIRNFFLGRVLWCIKSLHVFCSFLPAICCKSQQIVLNYMK